MAPAFYEPHHHPNPALPVIFHLDTAWDEHTLQFLHWHESVELLFCIEGSGAAMVGSRRILFSKGDLVIINSGLLHSIHAQQLCRYYCLIVDSVLFNGFGLPTADSPLQTLVRDKRVRPLFGLVAEELQNQQAFYPAAAKAAIVNLFVFLHRHYRESPGEGDKATAQHGGQQVAKKAIAYIRAHFETDIGVDDVCRGIGFSKSYLCHAFKQTTGQTIIGYINFVRCSNAKSLLATGRYNISESAFESGFRNLSYFTRTYKRLMGELPSQALRAGGG